MGQLRDKMQQDLKLRGYKSATARKYLDMGALFVAVGLDTTLLVRATTALAASFKSGIQAVAPSKTY